ncbi:hypothetical protein ABZT02_45330 [Streptomyces sp. NPDC005402]|uniref:hypothetical protein n=1 Tax=Streptomyces sp. NPDC005402 TaxID=3155338 RepID=UPI0033A435C8
MDGGSVISGSIDQPPPRPGVVRTGTPVSISTWRSRCTVRVLTTFARPWFGWGDALFAELLLDLTGRSTAALHPRLSTTEPPSR